MTQKGQGTSEYSAEKHFTTFNRTDSANRVQDVRTAITYFRTRFNVRAINLVGIGEGGIGSFFARALDLDQFDAGRDAEFEHKLFIPHLSKSWRLSGGFRSGRRTPDALAQREQSVSPRLDRRKFRRCRRSNAGAALQSLSEQELIDRLR